MYTASIPSPRKFWPSARWNIGDGWKATPATTKSPCSRLSRLSAWRFCGCGRSQGGYGPPLSATDGTAESTRGLLHLHQHGNGQYVHFEDAQVPHRRSGLPHHPPRPLTILALLLLYP